MSEFDSKALSSAREVMAIIKQEHIGGEAQLIAKIQLLFIEAMEYAVPQSNSPVIPDVWALVPVNATRAMIDAAARVEEDGYDAMHKAMLAAAPGKEG